MKLQQQFRNKFQEMEMRIRIKEQNRDRFLQPLCVYLVLGSVSREEQIMMDDPKVNTIADFSISLHMIKSAVIYQNQI